MIELFFPLILGIVFGTLTGLIPGIHVNLVNSLLLSNSALLISFFIPSEIPFFIIGMALMRRKEIEKKWAYLLFVFYVLFVILQILF